MFVAINRLTVKKDQGEGVETAFSKKGGLEGSPGFIGFELQKRVWTMGKEVENDEYLAVTRWESKEQFFAWTKSDAFKKAHSGPRKEAIIGGEPGGYEVVVERKPVEQAPSA